MISYQLSASRNIKLTIYNLLGQEVRMLINSFQSAGKHSVTWNARDNANNPVCSGIYLYKMEAGDRSFQKKMIFVR